MPFTLSHAAAALPFARTALPTAALVVGTMAPDLPYFLPLFLPREFSHSIAGVFTIDLLVGLLAFLLWAFVLRAPLFDYSPGWLRERMPRLAFSHPLLVPLAIVIGALTHIGLDVFTHEGSLDAVIPFMGQEFGPFSGANLVHGVFSVVGAVLIAMWVRRWVLRTPRVASSGLVSDGERRRWTWVLAAAFLVLFAIIWIAELASGVDVFDLHGLFVAFTIPVGIVGAVVVALCVVWRIRSSARLRSSP
ncbi:DUF4184 family protein [Glaciihabitans arcticus]|uniref:DUF4184 family protein n=1 Tax=Glaciihabitans arcticus TaxID=2668039 RepID=UPI001386B54F|nr:DUF4184 family protein [Glaciihabitans arcticus]